MPLCQDYDLCSCFNTERQTLLYCGLYPNEGRLGKILYNSLALYHIFATILITLSSAALLLVSLEDMLASIEALLVTLTHVVFSCKVFCFILKKQNLMEMEEILHSASFTGYSEVQETIIESHVRYTKRFGLFYKSVCFSICITYPIFPIFFGTKWALPFTGYNPFDEGQKIQYWTVFMVEWLSVLAAIYITTAMDMLTCMLITVATSQFEVLKDNLTNMRYDVVGAQQEFVKNVVLHYEILRLVTAVEETFSFGTFVQCILNVVVMCIAGFEMMLLPPNSIQFVSVFSFFNAMMFEVGMYCWFGHNIIASSENINDALYMSNWYEADSSLRKSIMIFMEKCKNSVFLRAQILPLSLQTFTSIMRSSYSYFAVLQTLYGSE